MAERKKIGLLFLYDESWAGGLYYLLNIIHALNRLPAGEQPELCIFYKYESMPDTVRATVYPHLRFLPVVKQHAGPIRLFEKLVRKLTGKNYSTVPQYAAGEVEFVFPCDYNVNEDFGSIKNLRKIYWIPDFQHKHLPHFFDAEELEYRDRQFAKVAARNAALVLSSMDAKQDFETYYPHHHCTINVLPFASVLPAYEQVDVAALNRRYGIETGYFISPNQFWAHKNHLLILKAVALLKHKGYNFKVLFTGKEHDYRNADYVPGLRKFIDEEGIGSYIQFLGFIDRLDQLQLMKQSIAVVQPSLFEGWSTVVEDTKAMNQLLILSDLRVHKEQCGDNALYFDPHNAAQLAAHMETCFTQQKQAKQVDYTERIIGYARNILALQ